MSEQELRNVLWADAVGSGLSIVFCIVGAVVLGGWLGVSAWIPFAVGLALIPWVLFLVRTARRIPLRSSDVGVIVAGNLGWAVGAALLLVGFPSALTLAGRWLVGVFSLGVLALGVVQWLGLRGRTSVLADIHGH